MNTKPKMGRLPDSERRFALIKQTSAEKLMTLPKAWSYTSILGVRPDQTTYGCCFPAGITVRMSDGSRKNIEDIRLLDEVLTAEGNVGRVMETMVRHHAGDIIELGVWGNRQIRCTPEHPVLTKRGYIAASELKTSDWVRLPRYAPESVTRVRLHNYLDAKEISQSTRSYTRPMRSNKPGSLLIETKPWTTLAVPEFLELTPELGYLLGLYVAEGGSGSGKVRFHFGKHEASTLVPETVSLIKAVFGIDATIQYRANNNVWVGFNGTGWQKVLSRMLGDHTERKHIPPELMAGPRDFLSGLLRGWLAGDGHISKVDGHVNGVTISRKLAHAMYDIAQALGLAPVIRNSEPKLSHGVVSRKTRWDILFTRGLERQRFSEVEEDCVWRKVASITRSAFEGMVYNLEVEGDHSYVAEGIGVHNCVSEAATQLMQAESVKHSRSGPIEMSVSAVYAQALRDTNPGQKVTDSGLPTAAGLICYQTHGYVLNSARPFPKPNDEKDMLAPVNPSLWITTFKEANFAAVNPDVDSIKRALVSRGPIQIGLTWANSWFTPDADGTLPPPDQAAGGHSTLIAGYDDLEGCFICPNSWGTEWGFRPEGALSAGWYKMPYSYATSYPDYWFSDLYVVTM